VLILMRSHAFDLPLETDEANYAYVGTRLAAGDRMYVDVWDHQPPGVFVLFAATAWAFGDAPIVFRWLAVAFSLATMVMIWAILDRRGTPWAALAAALLFALASSDPGTAGEGCNREIFMATLIVGAWWAVLRRPIVRRRDVLIAGVMLSLASVLKTVVAVHWIALAAWLVIDALLLRRASGGSLAAPSARAEARGSEREPEPATGVSAVPGVLWLAAGPALLWGSVFAYFALTDRLDAFVDAVFRFNLGYSDSDTGRLSRFAAFFQPERHPFIFDSALPIWIAGAVALLPLAAGAMRQASRRFALAVVLLLAASYVAVCLPAQFWPHYYYLMIPALVLAIGAAAHAVMEQRGEGRARATLSGAAVALILALLFVTQWREYLSRDGLDITIKRYNTRDYWAQAHGRNVESVTDPADTIFVFGNDAGIYYYAKRRCASRFTMATGLRSRYPDAAARQAILLDELRNNRPRLILETGEAPFPGWIEFLQERYYPAGADFHDKTGGIIMPVWCRKDAPIRQIDWNWDRSEAVK